MLSKEKIVRALELCARGCDGDGCIYNEEIGECDPFECPPRCIDLLAADALRLIKEMDKDGRAGKGNKGAGAARGKV